jgi:hypothetical protein
MQGQLSLAMLHLPARQGDCRYRVVIIVLMDKLSQLVWTGAHVPERKLRVRQDRVGFGQQPQAGL